MQFKYPELLYALFLLLIPILVHLFQLRRFEKIPFTNVKFLKEVILQTRKSSQIKKWLILCTRMLALAAMIFAFAQPYFANRNVLTTTQETVVYLDNSFSMQVKGEKGPLLQRAIQELLNAVPEDEELSVITNTKTYSKTTLKSIRNELLQLPYSSNQLTTSSVALKAKKEFSKHGNVQKNVVFISDFQQRDAFKTITDTTLAVNYVQLKPVNTQNIVLDSVYISDVNASNKTLTVALLQNNATTLDVPVSLFNNETLIAKSAARFNNDTKASITFSIPADQPINGHLKIEDTGLQFDDELYFSINASQKINVLAVNEASDDYLQRIYTEDEFNLTSVPLAQLNYNIIASQELIVLNELKSIPNAMLSALQTYKQQGGTLVIIPNAESNIVSYNALLKQNGFTAFSELQKDATKKITAINFSHPIFKNVFSKKVTNFQYPQIQSYFKLNSPHATILTLENNDPFLIEHQNTYVFTAALASENSNFKNAPLVVPIFYNTGKTSLKISDLYYITAQENSFDVQTTLAQDDILTMVSTETDFIPLQQTTKNKVRITTSEYPKQAGTYAINDGDTTLQYVSYNYDTKESDLNYHSLSNVDKDQIHNSVASFFEVLKNENNVRALWKWFVIFALLFLCLEMLILKFFKS